MTLPLAHGSIGAAFFDLLVNSRRVEPDTKKAFDQLARDADKITERAGRALGDSMTEHMADEIDKPSTFQRFQNAFARMFRRRRMRVQLNLDADIDQDSVNRATNSFFRRMNTSLAKGMASFSQTFLGGLIGILGSIGSSVGNVGSRGPFGAIIGAVVITLIPALVGAIAALISVFAPLINILLLLPTALAFVVAAIAPAIVAFTGLSDAMAAVMSGDKKKMAEAFKGIGKSVQNVLLDVKEVIPWFKQLRAVTQEALFSQLTNTLPNFFRGLTSLAFFQGFPKVAKAVGSLIDNIVTAANSPAVTKFVEALFGTTSRILEKAEPAFMFLLIGLADLGNATLPIIERIMNRFFELVSRFGIWLTDISTSGDINKFMEDLKEAVKDLMALAGSSWNLVQAIVGAAGEGERAQSFLDNIVYVIDKLTAFFESKLGEMSIQGMITLAEIFLFLLGSIIMGFAVLGIAIEGIKWGLMGVIEILKGVWNWLDRIWKKSEDVRRVISFLSPAFAAAKAIGFASGGLVTSPTLSMLGEGGRPEVVIPLTDPARARELANQTGLTSMLSASNNGGNIVFGPGAIQISFNGALPTQAEATSVGNAVGAGISEQLARRNLRTAVRTAR